MEQVPNAHEMTFQDDPGDPDGFFPSFPYSSSFGSSTNGGGGGRSASGARLPAGNQARVSALAEQCDDYHSSSGNCAVGTEAAMVADEHGASLGTECIIRSEELDTVSVNGKSGGNAENHVAFSSGDTASSENMRVSGNAAMGPSTSKSDGDNKYAGEGCSLSLMSKSPGECAREKESISADLEKKVEGIFSRAVAQTSGCPFHTAFPGGSTSCQIISDAQRDSEYPELRVSDSLDAELAGSCVAKMAFDRPWVKMKENLTREQLRDLRPQLDAELKRAKSKTYVIYP